VKPVLAEGYDVAIRGKEQTRTKSFLAALCGAALLVLMVVMTVQGLRSLGFKSVQGTVVSTKLQRVGHGYQPIIEYSYSVQGVNYRNNLFSYANNHGYTEERALAILDAYRAGTPCTVFYDPSNPQTSALSVAMDAAGIWIVILGMIIGLLCVASGTLAVCGITSPNKLLSALERKQDAK